MQNNWAPPEWDQDGTKLKTCNTKKDAHFCSTYTIKGCRAALKMNQRGKPTGADKHPVLADSSQREEKANASNAPNEDGIDTDCEDKVKQASIPLCSKCTGFQLVSRSNA